MIMEFLQYVLIFYLAILVENLAMFKTS